MPAPPSASGTVMPSSPSAPISAQDRKSTRLNSSHLVISYAVFCLKKKKNPNRPHSLDRRTTPRPPASVTPPSPHLADPRCLARHRCAPPAFPRPRHGHLQHGRVLS